MFSTYHVSLISIFDVISAMLHILCLRFVQIVINLQLTLYTTVFNLWIYIQNTKVRSQIKKRECYTKIEEENPPLLPFIIGNMKWHLIIITLYYVLYQLNHNN